MLSSFSRSDRIADMTAFCPEKIIQSQTNIDHSYDFIIFFTNIEICQGRNFGFRDVRYVNIVHDLFQPCFICGFHKESIQTSASVDFRSIFIELFDIFDGFIFISQIWKYQSHFLSSRVWLPAPTSSNVRICFLSPVSDDQHLRVNTR